MSLLSVLGKGGVLMIIEEVNNILDIFDFITSAVAVLFSFLHKPSVDAYHSIATNGNADGKDISTRVFRVAKMLQTILSACFFIGLVCFLSIKLDGIMLFPYSISLSLSFVNTYFHFFQNIFWLDFVVPFIL